MTLFQFSTTAIDGTPLPLKQFEGHVVLVVNTASKCGFTPQYAGLEELWQEFGEQGLTVIGFPCDQFANQEPGSETEIADFCQRNYGVSFPLTEKVDVNGSNADPIFTWLTSQAPGLLGLKQIKWNFTKFLVGRDGGVIKRFAPKDSPASLKPDIEKALAAGA